MLLLLELVAALEKGECLCLTWVTHFGSLFGYLTGLPRTMVNNVVTGASGRLH